MPHSIVNRYQEFLKTIVTLQSQPRHHAVAREPPDFSREQKDDRDGQNPEEEHRNSHENFPKRNDVTIIGKLPAGPPARKKWRKIDNDCRYRHGPSEEQCECIKCERTDWK